MMISGRFEGNSEALMVAGPEALSGDGAQLWCSTSCYRVDRGRTFFCVEGLCYEGFEEGVVFMGTRPGWVDAED